LRVQRTWWSLQANGKGMLSIAGSSSRAGSLFETGRCRAKLGNAAEQQFRLQIIPRSIPPGTAELGSALPSARVAGVATLAIDRPQYQPHDDKQEGPMGKKAGGIIVGTSPAGGRLGIR